MGEKLENRIQAIITKLNATLADAKKFDGGKTGAPGGRLRKCTLDVEYDLKCVRGHIHRIRAADNTAE